MPFAMHLDQNDQYDEARQRFCWDPYWKWQELQWSYQYDYVASLCMALVLLSNVAGRYNEQPDLLYTRVGVRVAAVLAICAEGLGLWLMWKNRPAYTRMRRWILHLQYAIVAPMVYWVTAVVPQEQSPSTLLSALQIIYRNGNLMCVMLACAQRMPWQRMAFFNAIYVAWMVWSWNPVYCTMLVNSKDYPLRQNKHLHMLNTAASALDYITGYGQFAGHEAGQGAGQGTGPWVSTAQSIMLHCDLGTSGASSSISSGHEACHQLLEGQCTAINSTFMVWFGVFFTTFLLVLAEQLSKWQWLHTHGVRMLPGAPVLFHTASRGSFLRALLLRLHCILDVPLLLLWVRFSAVYRPAPSTAWFIGGAGG